MLTINQNNEAKRVLQILVVYVYIVVYVLMSGSDA